MSQDQHASRADELRKVVAGDENLLAGLRAQIGAAAQNALFRPMGNSQFPPCDEPVERLLVIGQGQFGIASPANPVLVTHGLGNSVGLILHEPETRFGFLSHSDQFSFLYSNYGSDGNPVLGCKWGNPRLNSHIRTLYRLFSKVEGKFDFEAIIARGPDTSDESVRKIQDSLMFEKPPHIEISSSSVIQVPDGSIGIDVSSGLLMSFDPAKYNLKGVRDSHPILNAFPDLAIEGL